MTPQFEALLQRLPELDLTLRAADFTVSPDRWQSVYDLVYRLDQDDRLPDSLQVFGALIGPLLCNNQAEQQSFHFLFGHWAGEQYDGAETGEVLHQSILTGEESRGDPGRSVRQSVWSFVLVFLVLATPIAYMSFRYLMFESSTPRIEQMYEIADQRITPLDQEVVTGNETDLNPETGIDVNAGPDSQTANEEGLIQQPVEADPTPPVVQAEEPIRLDPQVVKQALYLAMPLFLLGAGLYLHRSRRQSFRRLRRGFYQNPLRYLRLRRNNKTLPFGWGEFTRRLKRSGSIETRKLDIEKTIDRTIHHAGLFAPVMLKHDPQPAYLVLMNRANTLDHDADRANALFDRLKQANVTVYRFEYHQDPRLCFSVGLSRRAYTLVQLARHYAGCRLILIGDGEALIDPFSGETQRWARQFEAWDTRVLLTPVPQPWDARESQLAHAGFAVAPFQVNGLEAVSDWLLKPSLDATWFQPGDDEPLPDLFALDQAAWLNMTPPPGYDTGATCRVLVEYLGQSGYRLLTACAAYPKLVSELTLTLDQLLFPADNGAAREKRLVRLTRLPWFREGRLPDYLRRELLDRADDTQIERIRDAYTGIFVRVSGASAR